MNGFDQADTHWGTGEPELPPPPSRSHGPQSGWTRAQFEAWLLAHQIGHRPPVEDGARLKYVLNACPFDPSHMAPDSAVWWSPGGLGFKCLHNSCADYKWKQFRERVQPDYQDRQQKVNQQAAPVPDDPIKVIEDLERIEDMPDAPLEYITEPLVITATSTIIAGPSGHGKTELSYKIVRDAIAMGRKCLILDRENINVFTRPRLKRLRLETGTTLRIWNRHQKSVPPLPDDPRILAWVEKTEPKPVIIVDTAIAFLEGQNENDAAVVAVFCGRLQKLAGKGSTVIAISHANKNGGYRGSTYYPGGVDQMWSITNTDRKGGLLLDVIRCTAIKTRGTRFEVAYYYDNGAFNLADGLDVKCVQSQKQFDILRQNPGGTFNELQKAAIAAGFGRNEWRAWLMQAILDGYVRTQEGPRKSLLHFIVEAGK